MEDMDEGILIEKLKHATAHEASHHLEVGSGGQPLSPISGALNLEFKYPYKGPDYDSLFAELRKRVAARHGEESHFDIGADTSPAGAEMHNLVKEIDLAAKQLLEDAISRAFSQQRGQGR